MKFDLLNTEDGRLPYLQHFCEKLLAAENWQPVVLTREWAKSISLAAGVYVIRHDNEIVYVGESGSLSGRMLDLLNTKNHTVRRSLGKKYFSTHIEYKKASSTVGYALSIELLLNEFINKNLTVAFLEMSLGRKELEDFIVSSIDKGLRLNIRVGRKAK